MRKSVHALICTWLIFIVSTCVGMWNVKTVGMTQGLDAWTIAARLGAISDETVATPVFNSDAVSFVITITNAGNYQLVENINYPIVIQASRVFLDLNSYTVTHTLASSNVITVTTALSEVAVYNGYVQNTGGTGTGSGIYVSTGCSKISLHDLSVFGCHSGVRLAGLMGTNNDVKDSDIFGVSLFSNDIGMLIEYASASTIKNCNALYSVQSGFELSFSQSNCFYDCNSLKTTGTATAAGFKSTSGTSNMFYRCAAQGTTTSSTIFSDVANGFLLTGSETKTKIVQSIVTQTDVVSSPTAVTCGIACVPLSNGGMTSLITPVVLSANEVRCAQWSPDSKYVLTTDGSESVVLTWDGTTLKGTATITQANALLGGSWSPDGKYFALGDNVGSGLVSVYAFNGATTTLQTSTVITTGQTPCMVEWEPNGKYIAVAAYQTTSLWIYLLGFNGTAFSFVSTSPVLSSPGWLSIAWSPDSQYIAVSTGSAQVTVLKLFPDTTLTSVAARTVPTGASTTGGTKWSPNGKFIATGDSSGYVTVLSFDGTDLVPACPSLSLGVVGAINALYWSPDGQYIVAVSSVSTFPIKILKFTGTSLTQEGATQNGQGAVQSVSWSADGKYIATGEASGKIRIFSAMYGPTKCVIDACKVGETKASNLNMGRGIEAGGNNLCVNTTCCNNGVNYSYGILNVYDGRFEISRNVVQLFDNISVPTLL